MGNTVSLSEPDQVLFAVWRKRRLDDDEEDDRYFDEFAYIVKSVQEEGCSGGRCINNNYEKALSLNKESCLFHNYG